MPYVRAGTKRRIFLVLAVVNALVSVALLPAAFGSSSWMVSTVRSRTVTDQLATVIDTSTVVSYGLFRFCQSSSFESNCASIALPSWSTTTGCNRADKDFKQRLNVSLTLLIFATALALPNAVSALFQFFTSTSIGNSAESRRFYFFVQLGCSALSLIATFVAIAVYGHTYNTWISCGSSFCTAQLNDYRTTLPVQQAARFAGSNQQNELECGYGASLGLAVVSLLSTLSYLALAAYNRSAPAAPVASPATAPTMMGAFDPSQQGRGAAHEPSSGSPIRLVPEGPDWEFDDSTQLFWSPSQELFFDPVSGHFYDGATECWYDPNEKRWYKL